MGQGWVEDGSGCSGRSGDDPVRTRGSQEPLMVRQEIPLTESDFCSHWQMDSLSVSQESVQRSC